MTKIKICGLTREEDILAVNESKPDYVGFLFVENKSRTVTKERAEKLKSMLDTDIKAVGVFLNDDIDFVVSLAKEGIIDLIQLHGDENEEYIRQIRQRTSVPIIKAVRAKDTETILYADRLDVDYLLIDTYNKNSYGGTGETFDWSMIPKLRKPYFLAGGLNPENLTKALNVGAYCLDLSSGAETDGLKDKEKIKKIVKIVRGG